MKIFKNALRTNRALIHFSKIQHISWNYHDEGVEAKVYSSAGTIVQYITEKELSKLLDAYCKFIEVSLYE
jgi:hypothetical protein